MTIRWEKLAGDTSVFAFKLSFAVDPDKGAAIDSDESLSWGGFQLWVGGRNLCAHQEEGERIDSVHWYLLPLLEWLATSWNPLLHEERPPVQNKADTAWESLQLTRFPPALIESRSEDMDVWEMSWHAWWKRHSLTSCRAGGLFPDIVFRRWRDQVEISWGPVAAAGTPGHFGFMEAEKGMARLPPKVVAEALYDVLRSGAGYLAEHAPESERIRALRRGVSSVRSAGDDRRLMWLAGLGSDESTVQQGWRRLKGYFKEIAGGPRAALLGVERNDLVIEGSCHAALMFGSVSPDVKKSDAMVLARHMVKLYRPEGDSAPLRAMVRMEPLLKSPGPPWEQGYALAEGVLEWVGDIVFNDNRVDIDQLFAWLQVQVEDVDIIDGSIRGVSIAGPQHRPGILINRSHEANGYPSGRRFTLAHELCHILFDRERGQRLAVASGPWAPLDIERRANAFAAMLLMPPALVQAAVAGSTAPLDTKEGVAQVAKRLNTSFTATLWHLTNLGVLDEAVQQRIRFEVTEAAIGESPG